MASVLAISIFAVATASKRENHRKIVKNPVLPHGISSKEKAPIVFMGSLVQAPMAIHPRPSERDTLVFLIIHPIKYSGTHELELITDNRSIGISDLLGGSCDVA